MGIRRFGMAAVCAVAAAVPLVVAAPADAAKPPPVLGTGHVACSMSGKVTFTPGLRSVPNSADNRASWKGKLACSVGETGVAGVRVLSGIVRGSGPPYEASCQSRQPDNLNLHVRWKTNGRKVLPTNINVAAGRSTNGRVIEYYGGYVSGSYALGQVPEVDLTLPLACGGAKPTTKSTFTGALDLINPCTPPIRTEVTLAPNYRDPNSPDFGYGSFVVIAACPYGTTPHPTGTITWSYRDARNEPWCAGATAPLVNTGVNIATSGELFRRTIGNGAGFWGVKTPMNTNEPAGCHGVNQNFTLRYSGDARYRPWNYQPWNIP